MTPLSRLRDLGEEIVRIGPAATAFRTWQQGLRLTGLDVGLSPVRQVGEVEHDSKVVGFISGGQARGSHRPFFIHGLTEIGAFLQSRTQEQQSAVIRAGRDASQGRIRAFRAWEAEFGHPPAWRLNPVTGMHWPSEHSKRVLTPERRRTIGDIKATWEIGRFLHVADILRAFALTADGALIDGLFEQIRSFEEENPLNAGPHWMSEQEVAIRGCMFALAFHALDGTGHLSSARRQLLARQLSACAQYCGEEIGLARYAIDNNHLVAGALVLYVAGTLLEGEPTPAWQRKGRDLLMGALQRQWRDDGAYVQPSHNYHRLALDYFLWALRLAEIEGDATLADAILSRMERSFRLLNAMIMADAGRLPNWGPNDGALFSSWTSCGFRDYRPLLTSLRYTLTGQRQYGDGPWDEQLVWLWGSHAASAPVEPEPPVEGSFPVAGLHTLRREEERELLVLRCGPVVSRYGQQADQLHVDVTWRGTNVLRDVGSYCYADARFHEWFRSTAAHNTVAVEGQSQMVPRRQFLFLRWPRARLLPLGPPPEGIRAWYCGIHDGYRRLSRQVLHTRLAAERDSGGWVIIDRLEARAPGKAVPFAARWQFAPGDLELDTSSATHLGLAGRFRVRWEGTVPLQARVAEGDEQTPEGWVSDHYLERTPAPALSIQGGVADEVVIVHLLGAEEAVRDIRLEVDRDRGMVDGVVIPIPIPKNGANQLAIP